MALRAGYRVFRCGVRADQELFNTFRWIMDHGEIGLPDKECLFGFPSALTYQLRAGADNGTLTAQLEQNIVMAIGGGDTM